MSAHPTVLLVHHTVSPALEVLHDAVTAGMRAEGLESIQVVVRPALAATAVDVLAADAFIFGTPANIGYMSGALKHFFDQVYYPCRHATSGAPYGVYVHGNQNLDGATRAVLGIAKGMGLRAVADPVEVRGEPARIDVERCWELGATVGATLLG